MSVVAGYNPIGSSDTIYIATVKGAPETLKLMFQNVPEYYDKVYTEMARKGARVLALGLRELGRLSHQEVRSLSREDIEYKLDFAGFVAISCPLKPDSKAVIKEIQSASHHVIMITGDAPLTACHVARELNLTKHDITLILSSVGEAGTSWQWVSVNEEVVIPVLPNDDPKAVYTKFDLCVTGEGLHGLSSKCNIFLRALLPHVRIFARVAPKQKEYIITELKSLGYVTLMCGDGTNDVGALKHANIGVAILPGTPEKSHMKPKPLRDDNSNNNIMYNSSVNKFETMTAKGKVFRRPDNKKVSSKTDNFSETQRKFQKLLKEMEEQDPAQIVKLGDASIAAPFTAKLSSILCICHIIKQGRCTLVTTLQMFKILALNALILAYSQSVLYLDGIKFSDMQATLQGLLLAGCFLFISRSKPLNVLSKERPLPNIFNVYTILTVCLQFLVHFSCLIYLVNEASLRSTPKTGKFTDLEAEFKPSILNSTVYIISVALQLCTFAVNYRGRPFMEGLSENKPLMYSIVISCGAIIILVTGFSTDLANMFSIVEFQPEFQKVLLTTLIADYLLSFIVDRTCLFFFGKGKLYEL